MISEILNLIDIRPFEDFCLNKINWYQAQVRTWAQILEKNQLICLCCWWRSLKLIIFTIYREISNIWFPVLYVYSHSMTLFNILKRQMSPNTSCTLLCHKPNVDNREALAGFFSRIDNYIWQFRVQFWSFVNNLLTVCFL